MTCGGDDGERVHAVVSAHQIPCDVSDFFAVKQHVKRAVGIDFADLPAVFGTEFFHRRPAAFVERVLQALLLSVADDEAFRRHGAYEVVELGLYRTQVGKDVGVVEFQIVQHGGTRAVMHKFGALVEKGGVVFVGFDDEKRRFAVRVLTRRLRQAGGNAEVFRYAADEEARRESGIFQDPGEHGSGGRFAVRPRHAEYPMMVQHVFRQPLRTGNIRQAAVQNRFNHIHPALGDIADNVNVGFKFVQLRGIEAFVYVYAQGFELGAHRRIHLRVATADFKPRFFGNGGHPAHKRAADTDNVDVFHDKTVF